jgi:hypothetical protein
MPVPNSGMVTMKEKKKKESCFDDFVKSKKMVPSP